MPLVLPILIVVTALLTTSALYRLFYIFSGRAERREYEQFKKHLNLALRDPQTAQLIYNVVMAERNRRAEKARQAPVKNTSDPALASRRGRLTAPFWAAKKEGERLKAKALEELSSNRFSETGG